MSGYHDAASTAPSSSLAMMAPVRSNDRADGFDVTSWVELDPFDGFDGDQPNNVRAPLVPDVAGDNPMSLSFDFFDDDMGRDNGVTLPRDVSLWDGLGGVGDLPSLLVTPLQGNGMSNNGEDPSLVDASLSSRSLSSYVSPTFDFNTLPTPFDPFPSSNVVCGGNRTFPLLFISPSPLPVEDQRDDTHHDTAAPQSDSPKPHRKAALGCTTRKPRRARPAKIKCPNCNEYPEGFLGPYELHRHNKRRHASRQSGWICRDPQNDTLEGWGPILPLDTCKKCRQPKKYPRPDNAAEHLRREHFRPKKRHRGASRSHDNGDESGAATAGAKGPTIPWLKAHGWLVLVPIDFVGDAATIADTVAETDDTATATATVTGTGTGTGTGPGLETMTTMTTMTTAGTPQMATTHWAESDAIMPSPLDFADDANMVGMGGWADGSWPPSSDDFLGEDFSRPRG